MRYVKIPGPLTFPNDVTFTFAMFVDQAILRHPNWADEWADDWDDWGRDIINSLMSSNVGGVIALQDTEHEKLALCAKAVSPPDPTIHSLLMGYRHAITRASREDPNKPLEVEVNPKKL